MSKKRMFIYLAIVLLSGIIAIAIRQIFDMESTLITIIIPLFTLIALFGAGHAASKK